MNQYQIEEYLTAVEQSVNQRFRLRTDIAWLLSVVYLRTMENVFDDVLFFSKFVTNAYLLMAREGGNTDSTAKLQKEFAVNIEKLHTLLRTIVKEAGEPHREQFVNKFLNMTPDCMQNLLAMAKELTWIKNYNLDKTRA